VLDLEKPMSPSESALAQFASIGRSWLLIGLVSAGLSACSAPKDDGGTKKEPPPSSVVTYDFVAPSVSSIAPSQVALGDTVTVFGMNFIDTAHGTLSAYLDGSFQDANGNTSRYAGNLPVPLNYVNPGQATFTFGPNVFFSPDGETLGTFHGNFQVISTLTVPAVHNVPGDTLDSAAVDEELVAGPSIYINQLRSVDGNCELVTTGTTSSSNLALGLETLGMTGTDQQPIQYTITINTPNLNLAFAQNKTFDSWPLTTTPSEMIPATANTGYTITVPATVDGQNDNSIILDPQHYQTVVSVNPPVNVNQQQTNQVVLAQLAAGTLDPTMNSTMLNIAITATDGNGNTLARAVNFPAYQALALQQWNGIETTTQIFPPEETDAGCQSGSAIGQRTYQYTDGTSQTLERSINLQSMTTITAGINVNAWILQASLSSMETFGVSVNQSVSSSTNSSYTATENIVGSNVGISYRQPVQTARAAPAVQYGTCGDTTQIGNMVLTNWHFNFDINQGPSCPPPPSSGMPAACAPGTCPQAQ
jgi:hypothetical protein